MGFLQGDNGSAKIGNYVVTSKVLGSGFSSEVVLGMNLVTGEEVAIKLFDRKVHKAQRVAQEYVALKKCQSNPNVVQLIDVVTEHPLYVCFVFKLIRGQTLLSFLDSHDSNSLSEPVIAAIFSQIVNALITCQNCNIVHRDIKLENVMLDYTTGKPILIDFGFAVQFNPDCPLINERSGSIHYCCPEAINYQYYDGRAADVWSLGVLLYVLSTGKFPFDDVGAQPGKEDVSIIFDKITRGDFDRSLNNHRSWKLCVLIDRMLDTNPVTRITLPEIQNCSWLLSFKTALDILVS